MRSAACSFIFVLAATAAPALHADVKLPSALSSHMVLQREMPVPIWGQAARASK